MGKPVKNTLMALGWAVLPDPAYSPDVGFKTFEEVRKWVDDFLASQDETLSLKVMEIILINKCIFLFSKQNFKFLAKCPKTYLYT